MLTACWSVKGGSGTTVVAASLVLGLASVGRSVVAADFAGDLAVALGVATPVGPGVLDWIDAGPDVPMESIRRISHRTEVGITMVPPGQWGDRAGASDPAAGKRLAQALRTAHTGGSVIADCGTVAGPAMEAFVAAADRSFLVLRPCYLALRKATAAPRPTAVVLVNEPERSLKRRDIEDALGVPVAAEIAWEPAVANAVDHGLLRARLPRRLSRALRDVAA